MTDNKASLADIVTASGHVGYDRDLQTGQILWYGPWQKLFGESRESPPGNTEEFAATILPDDHYIVFSDGANVFDREYRLRSPDGHIMWVAEHGTTDYDDGRPVQQRGLLRVIDQPRIRYAPSVLPFVQERDPLTGRLNRASMLTQMTRVLEGPRDIRKASAYMVVGIDNMSFVNEAVGTKAADIILSSVAGRLCQMSPIKAIIGRVTGDIFGILLPGLAADMKPLTERILQSFRDRPVTTATASVHITLSIGRIRLADQPKDAREIMIRAEQALSEAHKRGRNQHIEYLESPERSQESRTVLEIAERVKKALRQDRLRLAFQPVIEAATNQVLFYEALARLFHDDGRLMPAAEFIPIVEQQGLAFELDRHVINLAVHELESYPNLRLAVNISGLTAAQADWPEYLEKILMARPGVAQRLIIEITETAAIMDVQETKRLIASLNALGAQVAMDDFGAGATSIRHLRTLSLSIMKIDRELLLNLIGNSEQQHLVRMLIQLARGLGLKSVAEGVENEDVATWLRQEEVDMMQGYYFGRPTIDRPWLQLQGMEATENRAQSLLGTKDSPTSSGPTQLHVASVVPA